MPGKIHSTSASLYHYLICHVIRLHSFIRLNINFISFLRLKSFPPPALAKRLQRETAALRSLMIKHCYFHNDFAAVKLSQDFRILFPNEWMIFPTFKDLFNKKTFTYFKKLHDCDSIWNCHGPNDSFHFNSNQLQIVAWIHTNNIVVSFNFKERTIRNCNGICLKIYDVSNDTTPLLRILWLKCNHRTWDLIFRKLFIHFCKFWWLW
jgi:hypothetical protein